MRNSGGKSLIGEFGLYISCGWMTDLAFFYGYRPKEFVKQPIVQSDDDDDDEEESRVGKMPSSDEEDA